MDREYAESPDQNWSLAQINVKQTDSHISYTNGW